MHLLKNAQMMIRDKIIDFFCLRRNAIESWGTRALAFQLTKLNFSRMPKANELGTPAAGVHGSRAMKRGAEGGHDGSFVKPQS